MVEDESAGRAERNEDGRRRKGQSVSFSFPVLSLKRLRRMLRRQEVDALAMCMLEAGSKQVMNLSFLLEEGGRREASSRCEVMEGWASLGPFQVEELSCRYHRCEDQLWAHLGVPSW